MFEYEEAIDQYTKFLEDFIAAYELPEKWFKQPDHFAVKCADGLEYEYILQDLLADAQQATEVNMDGRRLATLHLTSVQPVGNFGDISWLEIMEPRPEKLGKDVVGFEHIEFYYSDFEEIHEVLQANDVVYTQQSNPGHAWISIVINGQNQELKLSNRPLEETIAQELDEGTARLL